MKHCSIDLCASCNSHCTQAAAQPENTQNSRTTKKLSNVRNQYSYSSYKQQVLTTRHHAGMVYAVVMCVCLSQVSVLLKWLNIGSRKQCHTIAQGLLEFSHVEDLGKIQTGSPRIEVPYAGGVD